MLFGFWPAPTPKTAIAMLRVAGGDQTSRSTFQVYPGSGFVMKPGSRISVDTMQPVWVPYSGRGPFFLSRLYRLPLARSRLACHGLGRDAIRGLPPPRLTVLTGLTRRSG